MRQQRRLSTASVNIFAGVAGGTGAKTNHARVMRRRDTPKERMSVKVKPPYEIH